MARLHIALGVLVIAAFVVGGAVAIYGFDYFEHAWGRANSLQVYVWLAIPAGLITALGSFFASVARSPRQGLGWSGALTIAIGYVGVGAALLFAGAKLIPFGLAGLAAAVCATAFVYVYVVLWLRDRSIAA